MIIENIQVKSFKFKEYSGVNNLQKQLINIECIDCGRVKEVRKDKFLSGNISDCICHQFIIENVKGRIFSDFLIIDSCVKNNRPAFKVECVNCGRKYTFERSKFTSDSLPKCYCVRYKNRKHKEHQCDELIGTFNSDRHFYIAEKIRMPNNRVGLCLICTECGRIKKVDSSLYYANSYGFCECDERYKWNTPEGAMRKYKEYIGKQINNLTIKDIYKDSRDGYYKFLCDCVCGAENISVLAHRLIKGNIFSCSKCKRSFGESIIEAYLKENKYNFSSEVRFKDLVGKRNMPYRFDFGVYSSKGELIGLIEYDGKQHEEIESLKKISGVIDETVVESLLSDYQYRDKRKNDYCIQKNIPLLRIKYTRSKKKIENQVYQFLSFIL